MNGELGHPNKDGSNQRVGLAKNYHYFSLIYNNSFALKYFNLPFIFLLAVYMWALISTGVTTSKKNKPN